MGDLKPSPCPERNYRRAVYSVALHSTTVVSAAFRGVFSSVHHFFPGSLSLYFVVLIAADLAARSNTPLDTPIYTFRYTYSFQWKAFICSDAMLISNLNCIFKLYRDIWVCTSSQSQFQEISHSMKYS